MLPDHPWLLGRLLHAARDLLGWSQGRLAGEAGVSMTVLDALELGRVPVVTQAMLAVMATLERSGVRFLPAADGLGQGVRYAATGSPEPSSAAPVPKLVIDNDRITAVGHARAAGGQTNSRLATAQACTARQRRLVEQLVSAGHESRLARQLLVQMEQSLLLMRQGQALRSDSSLEVGIGDRDHLAAAA